VIGISFQAWQQLGWHGSAATRLQLYRDRKALFTPFVAILGYGVFAIFLAYWLFGGAWFAEWRSTSTIFTQPWAQTLIAVNLAIFAWRIGNRVYFVGRLYGPDHAVLSIPRMAVNNFINFAATARAWRLFLGHILFGKRLVWDKTQHHFPSAEKLVAERQRLGDLLRMWQAIDADMLTRALDEQGETSAPLGQVLLDKGWIDEETLADAIAFQDDLERTGLDLDRLGDNTVLIRSGLGRKYRVVAVAAVDGRPAVAAARRPPQEAMQEIAAALGAEPTVRIATDRAITAALGQIAAVQREDAA
jgi:bacteriophage N4 adsorption protein B